jgi:hypothetical protein
MRSSRIDSLIGNLISSLIGNLRSSRIGSMIGSKPSLSAPTVADLTLAHVA